MALMGRFWKMDREELQAVVRNPKSSMGEIMVAAVMAKAAKDGDYNRLAFLLDRTIGKVKDVVEQHEFSHMSTVELIELVKEQHALVIEPKKLE